MKHLSPAKLRHMAEGKAMVLLSAAQIKELADYIEAMQKRLREAK